MPARGSGEVYAAAPPIQSRPAVPGSSCVFAPGHEIRCIRARAREPASHSTRTHRGPRRPRRRRRYSPSRRRSSFSRSEVDNRRLPVPSVVGVADPRPRRLQGPGRGYTYDPVGNVTAVANDMAIPPPSTFGGPTSQTFTYDDLNRLAGATGTFQNSPDKANRYTLSLGTVRFQRPRRDLRPLDRRVLIGLRCGPTSSAGACARTHSKKP